MESEFRIFETQEMDTFERRNLPASYSFIVSGSIQDLFAEKKTSPEGPQSIRELIRKYSKPRLTPEQLQEIAKEAARQEEIERREERAKEMVEAQRRRQNRRRRFGL